MANAENNDNVDLTTDTEDTCSVEDDGPEPVSARCCREYLELFVNLSYCDGQERRVLVLRLVQKIINDHEVMPQFVARIHAMLEVTNRADLSAFIETLREDLYSLNASIRYNKPPPLKRMIRLGVEPPSNDQELGCFDLS